MSGHQAPASHDPSDEYHFIGTPEGSDTEGARRPRRAPKHVREVSKQQAAMRSEIQGLGGIIGMQGALICTMQQQIHDIMNALQEKVHQNNFEEALSLKVSSDDFNAALGEHGYIQLALQEKVSHGDLQLAMIEKMDKVDFKQELSKKIDKIDFEQVLNEKVCRADFERALSQKVDETDFKQALDKKMDEADLEQALSEKISKAIFEEALNFEQSLSKKVDEVDFKQALSENMGKAGFEQTLNEKVCWADFNRALNEKMDKVDFGKALLEKDQANFVHALPQQGHRAELQRALYIDIKVQCCGFMYTVKGVMRTDTIATVKRQASKIDSSLHRRRALRAGSRTLLNDDLTIMHYGIVDGEVLYFE